MRYILILVSTACIGIAGSGSWTQIGPFWGNTEAVELAPSPSSVIYATSADDGGGIFYSDDIGANWDFRSQGLDLWGDNYSLKVCSFAMDPVNPEFLYCSVTDFVLGDEDYVYRSTDSGNSWSRILQTEDSVKVVMNGISAYDGIVFSGRMIELLVDGHLESGNHETSWNTLDVPHGLYFVRAACGSMIESRAIPVVSRP